MVETDSVDGSDVATPWDADEVGASTADAALPCVAATIGGEIRAPEDADTGVCDIAVAGEAIVEAGCIEADVDGPETARGTPEAVKKDGDVVGVDG